MPQNLPKSAILRRSFLQKPAYPAYASKGSDLWGKSLFCEGKSTVCEGKTRISSRNPRWDVVFWRLQKMISAEFPGICLKIHQNRRFPDDFPYKNRFSRYMSQNLSKSSILRRFSLKKPSSQVNTPKVSVLWGKIVVLWRNIDVLWGKNANLFSQSQMRRCMLAATENDPSRVSRYMSRNPSKSPFSRRFSLQKPTSQVDVLRRFS